MKLSEAIRLGAMLKPQAFGGFHQERPIGILGLRSEVIGTCALGAAFDAAGCPCVPRDATDDGTMTRPRQQGDVTTTVLVPPRWDVLFITQACPAALPSPCPVLARGRGDQVIAHLNDEHHWTREQIADWVETVEREREAQTPAPQPAEAAR